MGHRLRRVFITGLTATAVAIGGTLAPAAPDDVAAAASAVASAPTTVGINAGAPLQPPAPARLAQPSQPLSQAGPAKRAGELAWKRTESSKSHAMTDGTVQLELSPSPMHFRDNKGEWRDIDPKVQPGSGDDVFENDQNVFRSHFGKSTDRLVRFEADGSMIGLGAVGETRKITPTASGSTVTFPDVFGTADVRYAVSSTGLKEDIVLEGRGDIAASYEFELTTGGLTARQFEDGSIGFFKKAGDEDPRFVMPAPYMYDATSGGHADAGWSDDVTQTVTQRGGKSIVTVTPDAAWLDDPKREFPVVIDPTITVVPDPAAAQDAAISSLNSTTTYPSNSTIPVGRSASTSTWRGLYKFDTSMIPAATKIRSADLDLFFNGYIGTDSNSVKVSAHQVTKAWTETTATWSSMSTSYVTSHGHNLVEVDNTRDPLAIGFEGPWKRSGLTGAIDSTIHTPGSGTTPDTFTWDVRVPGPGNYRVDASYVPATTRGVPSYQVTGPVKGSASDSSVTASIDQTQAAPWAPYRQLIAEKYFEPDRVATIKMTRQQSGSPIPATNPIADAVRLVEGSWQVKGANQRDSWHSFAVGNMVQNWVTNPAANYGFMLKATDESSTALLGGPYYHASENGFGATETRPKLVITYDEPGVTLNVPRTIHSSGPELTWAKYVDPTPAAEDDLVEYQIFRGCQTLPSGACTDPAGEYFTNNTAAQMKLIDTVPADTLSYTDASAAASSATEPATYHYWVVARTAADTHNGQNGRAASNVQTVTTPRDGRIARVLTGNIADTTLSAKLPTTNLARPDSTTGDNRFWLQAGNSHATYGDERAVMEFDTSQIKEDVKVTAARLELFKSSGSGSGATFDLHALTKDFAETQATWNQAASTSPWSGGSFEPTALASQSALSVSPTRVTFADAGSATTFLKKVQSWVDDPGANHGFLLKARDEVASQQYLSFVNSESPEGIQAPRLVVEHLVKNAQETYEANQIPERFVPGTTITTPVRVTNTTDATWPAGLQLSYRWTAPGSSTDITVSGERNFVPLGRALAPGESVSLNLPIRTPINADTGSKRLAYDLYLDLWTGSGWFSTTNPPAPAVPRPAQGCVIGDKGLLCVDRYVEDPTSTQLGLEKFLSYTGEETGGGSQLLSNLYSGNVVWSYDAMSNPSIGPRTFVRVAYNSMDVTDDGAGYGISVQPGTLTRLGSRLSVPSSANGSAPNLMTFIDGDGTTHKYKLNEAKTTASKAVYDRPAGVALELAWNRTAATTHMWVFSRPDGTRFYYDQDTGLPTSVVDRNANATTFGHDSQGRLTSVTDATNRQTLELGYDTAGLRWIRELPDRADPSLSGRALKFNYNSTHQLTSLQDGGPFSATTGTFTSGAVVKTFGLGYTDTSVNSNAKLNKVTDPQSNSAVNPRPGSTDITYWQSTDPNASTFAGWPRQYTDRRGKATQFAYEDPDASTAKDLVATVTDVNGTTPSTTTYRMDGYGRTTSIKDANVNAAGSDKTTNLVWDTDHNVIRLEEPDGAVSTWRYDVRTGYPLEVRDALSVKNNTPGMKLEYADRVGPTGAVSTVMMKKTSPQGRVDTFDYDAEGNLLKVRNGLPDPSGDGDGFGPTYTYNPNGTLATVTDARSGVTTYGTPSVAGHGYDENGYPLSMTDPMGFKTEFTYDRRGNVIQTIDAEGRITTAQYDALGRPAVTTTPFEGTVKRTTTTDYDLNDNVVKETAPNGAYTSYEFDAADNVTVKHLPDNGNGVDRRIKYVYDDLGRKLQEIAPEGVASVINQSDFITHYDYDRIGQILHVTTPFVDADGNLQNPRTSYTYDLVGNRTSETDPRKNASGATDYTTKWTYDANHQVTAVTDAAGFTSKNLYDRDGLLIAEIDALGNKKSTDYDAAGRPTKVHVPHTPIGATKPEDRVTETVYDPAGNVIKTIRPSGKFTETVYDKNNRPIQKKGAFTTGDANYGSPPSTFIEYLKTGEVLRQSESTFGSAGSKWSTFSYFESGDVKASTDPWGITSAFEYNQIGQQTKRTLKSNTDDATRSKSWAFYPDGSLKTHSDTAAQQPVDIIDNVDAWQSRLTGTWATVTGGTNTHGANYRTHAAAAAGTVGAGETFTWDVTPDVGGSFEVLVSCPVRSDATTAASYTVNHATGASTATVNQQACTSTTQWQSLGTFTFSGGSTKTIVLKPSVTGVVSADALKLVAKDPVKTNAFVHKYDLNGLETEVVDVNPDTANDPSPTVNPDALTDTFRTEYDGLGRPKLVKELKSGTTLRQTAFTHDLNSNPTSAYAQQFAVNGLTAASRYTGFNFDVRNLVDTVESGPTPTTASDHWSYTYDARGMRKTLTKPNGNIQTSTYHEDGKVRTLVEKLGSGAAVTSQHYLKYWPDGDLKEDNAKVDQGNSTNTVDQVSTYDYTPSQQLAKVTKTGATGEKGDNERYVYDAAGNIKEQQIGTVAVQCMTYDRDRLLKTETRTGATSCVTGTVAETRNHRYDPLGRATTVDVGSKVVERHAYDGFDRMVRHQKWKSDGTHEVTKSIGYDVFDRTTNQAVKVTTQPSVSTRFLYLGLEDQVAVEEQTNTAGTYEVSKAYTYGPGGEKLALVDTPVNLTTTKKLYYGTSPRGDVETLTDSAGKVTSTYRYTAYGSPDKNGTTGDDAITNDPVKDADVVNPYRFNAKRFDGATGTYDMGFRDYNPGLNRFLSRDMYDGALDDMALGMDPWNTNRYAFAGGNPIGRVELDGHWGISLSDAVDSVSDAVDSVSDAVTEVADDVSDAASAVGDFVVEHKATIAGIATGIVVGVGCTVATGGGGAVACLALAGAAGSAVTNALDENADHSVGGYAKAMAGGAAINVATLGAGKALAPVLAKAAVPLKTAAGNAGGKLASGMRTAVSKMRGCSSFAGSTVVLMADGSEKPIEDVAPGDMVIATDPETGEQVAKEVTTVWVHDDTLIDLQVDGETITTTEDHPFWNLTDGEWQQADQLDPGDQVLTEDGRAVTVHGLLPSTAYTALAYNLTVEGIHTYHVGRTRVLVHNTAGCSTVGPHGKMPSPRPGMQSHHGVNDVWARHNIPGYSKNAAPAVLMPEADHRATFGVFNRFRSEISKRQGTPGSVDWEDVSPGTAWRLAEEQFAAAGTADDVVETYFSQWNQYIEGLF